MDVAQKENGQAPIAHKSDVGTTHDLAEHLYGTADLACRFAAPWGGDEAAHLAAMWHDLGKYAAEFQAMIRAAGENGHLEDADAAPKARVIHSTAGAQWAVKKFVRVPTANALFGFARLFRRFRTRLSFRPVTGVSWRVDHERI